MADYNKTYDLAGDGIGTGWGGFGGSGLGIIAILVVLWLLFDRGHGKHGGGGEVHGMRPAFVDESNWEQEVHFDKQFYKLNSEIRCEGEKTRALIEQNYIQDLRDRLAEKNSEVQTLKSEMFVGGMIGKVDRRLDNIECQMLKRPPTWGTAVMPNTHLVEPQRGCVDWC